MSRLITGLFYDPSEAERAVSVLREHGFSEENIIVEREMDPSTWDRRIASGQPYPTRTGQKLEMERRFAGRETGIIIGLALGAIAGMAVGMIAGSLDEVQKFLESSYRLSPFLTNYLYTTPLGAVLGMFTGGLIGWIIDYTLDRLGAGPAPPEKGTLVSVRAGASEMSLAYNALGNAHAHHVFVASQPFREWAAPVGMGH